MSAKLFTAMLQYAFKELDWTTKGINIDGKNLSNLRFADDIVLITDDIREADEILYNLTRVTEKVGLHIHKQKTKLMAEGRLW